MIPFTRFFIFFFFVGTCFNPGITFGDSGANGMDCNGTNSSQLSALAANNCDSRGLRMNSPEWEACLATEYRVIVRIVAEQCPDAEVEGGAAKDDCETGKWSEDGNKFCVPIYGAQDPAEVRVTCSSEGSLSPGENWICKGGAWVANDAPDTDLEEVNRSRRRSCRNSVDAIPAEKKVGFDPSVAASYNSETQQCRCPEGYKTQDFKCAVQVATEDGGPRVVTEITSEPAASGAEGYNEALGQPCRTSAYMQRVAGASPTGTTTQDENGALVCADDAGGIQAYVQRRRAEIETFKETCKNKAKSANNCCNSPLSCLFQDNDEAVETVEQTVAMGGQLYSQVLGTRTGTNAGQRKLCEFLNKASTISAGMNAAGAGTCLATKTTCTGSCRSSKESIVSELRQCGYELGTGTIPQSVFDECSMLVSVLRSAAGNFDAVIAGCEGLDVQVAQQAMQAIATQQGASYAKQCADAAGEREADAFSNGLDAASFTTDCSDPANASSPYCLECGGPDAANNPFCTDPSSYLPPATAGLGDGSTGGVEFGDGDGGAAVDTGLVGIDQTYFGDPVAPGGPANARSNGVGGGGGGGIPPGGGNAQLGNSNKGGQRGASVSANVLRGLSGGSGYSSKPTVSRVGFASQGGFSGYGRGKAKKDKGLDLKQFLPGGKKDPRKRGVAGLARATGEAIGRKEENIFHKMAKKYQQMCRLKRMWDCPSAKRR